MNYILGALFSYLLFGHFGFHAGTYISIISASIFIICRALTGKWPCDY
jgi:1,4-dihydroxy-2-naphthoate octaprenyltransferase